MAERYVSYHFHMNEQRKSEDDLKFATAEKMMDALESLCQEGVQLEREINNVPLVGGVKVLSLVGNAVVKNKTSGVAPYCQTEIICQGMPTSNIVERYREFYRADPSLIHF
ncbi:MAG: hypothetical protein AABX13_04890 [Nanoarchaeota archaeon]